MRSRESPTRAAPTGAASGYPAAKEQRRCAVATSLAVRAALMPWKGAEEAHLDGKSIASMEPWAMRREYDKE